MFYLQEGIRRTLDSYQHLRAGVQTERDGPSKAKLLLGNGKGANLFLSSGTSCNISEHC